MALKITEFNENVVVVQETALSETAVKNIRQGPTTLHHIKVKESDASPEIVYLKLYDAIDIAESTTDPDMVIKCPAGAEINVPVNVPHGKKFLLGLCMLGSAGVTGKGVGVAGDEPGTTAVTLTLT